MLTVMMKLLNGLVEIFCVMSVWKNSNNVNVTEIEDNPFSLTLYFAYYDNAFSKCSSGYNCGLKWIIVATKESVAVSNALIDAMGRICAFVHSVDL